ncbi:MAG: geranyltranstransferase [Gemmatimonadota bacterium]|nr:MAG: geranyltranstransferase [Gemmatimonadota bacterium]
MNPAAPPVLERYRPAVERALLRVVPAPGGPLQRVHDAMAYSLEAGGKRLRPTLCLATCEAVGGAPEQGESAAAALELIHTYSLIHDDLPCMDDDDLRRGRATNHRVFGEALAVLAGDALLTRAFEVLAEDTRLPAEIRVEMVTALARAAGSLGMVGGQALDLAAEETAVELSGLREIHSRKTGALFGASCRLGALAGRGPADAVTDLAAFGERIGLAFQIVDDLLDETASAEVLGKAAGKDRDRGKATYPSLLGMEESRRHLDQVFEDAQRMLVRFGSRAEPLAELARFVVERSS